MIPIRDAMDLPPQAEDTPRSFWCPDHGFDQVRGCRSCQPVAVTKFRHARQRVRDERREHGRPR